MILHLLLFKIIQNHLYASRISHSLISFEMKWKLSSEMRLWICRLVNTTLMCNRVESIVCCCCWLAVMCVPFSFVYSSAAMTSVHRIRTRHWAIHRECVCVCASFQRTSFIFCFGLNDMHGCTMVAHMSSQCHSRRDDVIFYYYHSYVHCVSVGSCTAVAYTPKTNNKKTVWLLVAFWFFQLFVHRLIGLTGFLCRLANTKQIMLLPKKTNRKHVILDINVWTNEVDTCLVMLMQTERRVIAAAVETLFLVVVFFYGI